MCLRLYYDPTGGKKRKKENHMSQTGKTTHGVLAIYVCII